MSGRKYKREQSKRKKPELSEYSNTARELSAVLNSLVEDLRSIQSEYIKILSLSIDEYERSFLTPTNVDIINLVRDLIDYAYRDQFSILIDGNKLKEVLVTIKDIMSGHKAVIMKIFGNEGISDLIRLLDVYTNARRLGEPIIISLVDKKNIKNYIKKLMKYFRSINRNIERLKEINSDPSVIEFYKLLLRQIMRTLDTLYAILKDPSTKYKFIDARLNTETTIEGAAIQALERIRPAQLSIILNELLSDETLRSGLTEERLTEIRNSVRPETIPNVLADLIANGNFDTFKTLFLAFRDIGYNVKDIAINAYFIYAGNFKKISKLVKSLIKIPDNVSKLSNMSKIYKNASEKLKETNIMKEEEIDILEKDKKAINENIKSISNLLEKEKEIETIKQPLSLTVSGTELIPMGVPGRNIVPFSRRGIPRIPLSLRVPEIENLNRAGIGVAPNGRLYVINDRLFQTTMSYLSYKKQEDFKKLLSSQQPKSIEAQQPLIPKITSNTTTKTIPEIKEESIRQVKQFDLSKTISGISGIQPTVETVTGTKTVPESRKVTEQIIEPSPQTNLPVATDLPPFIPLDTFVDLVKQYYKRTRNVPILPATTDLPPIIPITGSTTEPITPPATPVPPDQSTIGGPRPENVTTTSSTSSALLRNINIGGRTYTPQEFEDYYGSKYSSDYGVNTYDKELEAFFELADEATEYFGENYKPYLDMRYPYRLEQETTIPTPIPLTPLIVPATNDRNGIRDTVRLYITGVMEHDIAGARLRRFYDNFIVYIRDTIPNIARTLPSTNELREFIRRSDINTVDVISIFAAILITLGILSADRLYLLISGLIDYVTSAYKLTGTMINLERDVIDALNKTETQQEQIYTPLSENQQIRTKAVETYPPLVSISKGRYLGELLGKQEKDTRTIQTTSMPINFTIRKKRGRKRR